MKITKIYFPMITVVKIEEKDMDPRYFTGMSGGAIHPSEDVIRTEEDWRRTLKEAELKGVRVEVREI